MRRKTWLEKAPGWPQAMLLQRTHGCPHCLGQSLLWGPGFEALEEGPRVVRQVVGKAALRPPPMESREGWSLPRLADPVDVVAPRLNPRERRQTSSTGFAAFAWLTDWSVAPPPGPPILATAHGAGAPTADRPWLPHCSLPAIAPAAKLAFERRGRREPTRLAYDPLLRGAGKDGPFLPECSYPAA